MLKDKKNIIVEKETWKKLKEMAIAENCHLYELVQRLVDNYVVYSGLKNTGCG